MPSMPAQWWSGKLRQPEAVSSKRLKLLAPLPSEMSRSEGPPRLRHSKENIATSCGIWRHKSSERGVEAKLTSSLPARLVCTWVHQSSRTLLLLPTTFCWDTQLHHLHSSYCEGLPQWKNSQLPPLIPHQCPSSLLGPKDDTLCQTLWRVCLRVEPLQRQLWENPPAPSNERSHPGAQHSSQAMPRYLARTLIS